jgi:hypothetical protein
MRHLNLHDNLSVIGVAAEDFFFAGCSFQGSFWAGHVSYPKGYLMVRYFP